MATAMAAPAWMAVAALLVNATTWGLSWWPFRHLQGLGLHPLWTTAVVYLAAALAIGLWRPGALRQVAASRGLWVLLIASGCTNAAFNWAVTVGEVARVVLLFYLTPLWTVLLAWLLLGEAPTRRVLSRLALALAGAALVLGAGGMAGAAAASAGSTPPVTGIQRWADALGILGGMSFALTNVMLRREAAQPEAARALAMFGGGALVAGGLAALIASGAGGLAAAGVGWPSPRVAEWWLPALLLALAFGVGNLALQYGAARLPANVTAVVMPAEVPIAALSAAWWGGEAIRPAVWVGGGLILAATVLAARGGSNPPAGP